MTVFVYTRTYTYIRTYLMTLHTRVCNGQGLVTLCRKTTVQKWKMKLLVLVHFSKWRDVTTRNKQPAKLGRMLTIY